MFLLYEAIFCHFSIVNPNNIQLYFNFAAIVDVMREILRALKDFARQMKEAFIAIRDLFLEISKFYRRKN